MRSVITTLLLCLAGGPALAGAHDDFSKVPERFDDALSAEIQAFLDEYAAVYNRQDYEALLGMWDTDFAAPIYMAEEVDPPLHGRERIARYFNPIPGFSVLDGIRNRYCRVRASYLADDLAIATYRLDFDIKVKRQAPMSSWDRVMAVFRRGDDGQWRMLAYAEAPMAPLTMVRRMLENAVPEDFEAWLDAREPSGAD